MCVKVILQSSRAHRVTIDWVSSRLTEKARAVLFLWCLVRAADSADLGSLCMPAGAARGADDAGWRLTPRSFSAMQLWSNAYDSATCYVVSILFSIIHTSIPRFPQKNNNNKKQSAASLEKQSSMSSCDTAWILPLGIRSIYTACSIPSLLEIRESDKTENLKICRLEVRTSL